MKNWKHIKTTIHVSNSTITHIVRRDNVSCTNQYQTIYFTDRIFNIRESITGKAFKRIFLVKHSAWTFLPPNGFHLVRLTVLKSSFDLVAFNCRSISLVCTINVQHRYSHDYICATPLHYAWTTVIFTLRMSSLGRVFSLNVLPLIVAHVVKFTVSNSISHLVALNCMCIILVCMSRSWYLHSRVCTFATSSDYVLNHCKHDCVEAGQRQTSAWNYFPPDSSYKVGPEPSFFRMLLAPKYHLLGLSHAKHLYYWYFSSVEITAQYALSILHTCMMYLENSKISQCSISSSVHFNEL